MYCMKCGTKLPDYALFCSKCGNSVKLETDSSMIDNEYAGNDIETGMPTGSLGKTDNNTKEYSEIDVSEGKCPYCQYNGNLIIIEKLELPFWKKILIYAIGVGLLLILACFLDMLLTSKIPWIIAIIVGTIMVSFYKGVMKDIITHISIRRLLCPKCKKEIVCYLGKIMEAFLTW